MSPTLNGSKYTVNNFYYEDEPLIFDENYDRKDSYFALRDALKTVCIGGIVGGEDYKNLCEKDKTWGSEWRQPESDENDTLKEGNRATSSGDSAPDWLQSDT